MQIDEKKVRYVDRPEVSETFVDNVRMISVDGRNMKEAAPWSARTWVGWKPTRPPLWQEG